MLLGTLDASLLGNMLAGKGINRAGEGLIRAGYGSKIIFNQRFLILHHPLTNFGTQRFYQNETGYNRVYSGDNLPEELKDRASFGFN